MKANCVKCGKEFEKRGNTKTCSEECSPTPYRKRKDVSATCIICGSVFQKTTNSALTCGKECSRENMRRYMMEYDAQPDRRVREKERGRVRWQNEHRPIFSNCVVCGAEYQKTNRSLSCSEECRAIWDQGTEQLRHRSPEPMRALPMSPRSIAPFPDHLDRVAFGHWLSGFTDGEGSFMLRYKFYPDINRFHFAVAFRIVLRDDDADILRLIQSYWGCGTFTFGENSRAVQNAKPIACYGVQRAGDLAEIVIPHFNRFPLLAKKRSDFDIWRRAVELNARVQARNSSPKWTAAERELFCSLSDRLKESRRYKRRDESSEVEEAGMRGDQMPLFNIEK